MVRDRVSTPRPARASGARVANRHGRVGSPMTGSIPVNRTILPTPALLAASNSSLGILHHENEHNRHQRPNGDVPDESLAKLLSSYAQKQRWTLLKGFRILAKVAVRAHMGQQVPGSKAAPDDGGGEEKG